MIILWNKMFIYNAMRQKLILVSKENKLKLNILHLKFFGVKASGCKLFIFLFLISGLFIPLVPDVIRINQTTKTVFNTEKKMFGSLFEECRCVSVWHHTSPRQLKAAQRVIFNKVDTMSNTQTTALAILLRKYYFVNINGSPVAVGHHNIINWIFAKN